MDGGGNGGGGARLDKSAKSRPPRSAVFDLYGVLPRSLILTHILNLYQDSSVSVYKSQLFPVQQVPSTADLESSSDILRERRFAARISYGISLLCLAFLSLHCS